MPTLASLKFSVEYTGKTARAAMAPWEGVNALDAAVLAYNGISVLETADSPFKPNTLCRFQRWR